MTYDEWAARWPQAAHELQTMLTTPELGDKTEGGSEARAQQLARLDVARYSVNGVRAMAWRNNVGATPAKTKHVCPRCSFLFEQTQQPTRYGLANDSMQLNRRIKSADLICAIPRLIVPEMVGQVIAQFGSIEVKRPGWVYSGKDQEPGQMAWAALIQSVGGFATFSTGRVEL